ncbi:MAG: two pore domain potassium channel family protein [Ardenticatenaceae bacterium]|nr:two pore domain potassium channel family protein [Ardenticatenaceae bacterium]MCB9444534.1 two pore domain potassium channel family protein [Ardenticatenaceae bacterium]
MPALFLLLYRLGKSIWNGLKEPEFRGLFTLTVIVIFSGAWFYHVREGWSWLDSFYFTVVTLTTVGYGDLSPQTALGKIFTMIYILAGLSIISSFIVLLAEHQQANRSGLRDKLSRGFSTTKQDVSESDQ